MAPADNTSKAGLPGDAGSDEVSSARRGAPVGTGGAGNGSSGGTAAVSGAGSGGSAGAAGAPPSDAGAGDARASDGAATDARVGADAMTCGAGGQLACPGNVCGGEACVNADGVCISVGALCGLAAGGKCGADGSCGAMGMTCGGLDEPCCRVTGGGRAADRDFCSAPGTACPMAMGGGDKCVSCGAAGQPCCGGNTCRTGACTRENGSRSVCR
jgi:hypothetical protein